jgi:hypothetical protein
MNLYTPEMAIRNEQERPTNPFYEVHEGGILSKDKKCIYFLGIIDTLTVFG